MPFGAGPWGNGGLGGGSSAELTIFDNESGASQQRVSPANYVESAQLLPAFSASDFQFVLGDDVPGRKWRAAVGDYVEVAQTADWAANILRGAVQVRPPPGPPAGVVWTFTFTVDGVTWDAFSFSPGDPERTRDTIGVRGAAIGPTPHTVAFRLTLSASPTTPTAMPAPHPNPQVVLSVANATNPAIPLPIVVTTTAPHGLADGDTVLNAGIAGNLVANGYFHVEVVDDLNFALTESHVAWAPDTRFPLNSVAASDGSFYRATSVSGTGTSGPLSGGGPFGSSTFVDNPGPNQIVWTFLATQASQGYTGGGTVTAPPNVAVTTSLDVLSEVELPGVYVIAAAEDDS